MGAAGSPWGMSWLRLGWMLQQKDSQHLRFRKDAEKLERRWRRVTTDPCLAGGCLRTAASSAGSKEPQRCLDYSA